MERRDDILTGVGGIVFIALTLVAAFIAGAPPKATASVDTIRRFYVDNRGPILVGAVAGTFGFAGAIAFLAGIWSRLRRALRADDPLPIMWVVGWTFTGALITVGAAIQDGLVLHKQFTATSSDDIVRFVWNAQNAAFSLGSIGIAVALAAFGLAALRTRGLVPSWLGWSAFVVSAVNALAVLGGAKIDLNLLGLVGFLLLAVWVVAVSVLLLTRRLPAPAAAR